MYPIRKRHLVLLATLLSLTACATAAPETSSQGPRSVSTAHQEQTSSPAARTYKIVHVMSYHSPWEWTDAQLEGFKASFKNVQVDWKVIQLDAKRISSPDQLEQMGQLVRGEIDAYQPDLIYTSDDEAQRYVAKHYNNTKTPVVFSGVNWEPSTYGFDQASNVTGVLETEHFVDNVKLMKQISPSVRKVAVVFDQAEIWKPVTKRMKAQLAELPPEIDFPIWDTIETFEQFKQRMTDYPNHVDAVALIGIFNFKDENGANVPYQDVLRWTAENSKLPDFSFWKDRAAHGTLSTVTVSGYEQGYEAGILARRVLEDGEKPSSLPMKPTVKGEPIVSLARAKKLNMKLDSTVLLSSKVYNRFIWEP
ncbi:ABC transporter substrate-binding protein [Paenibacillus sp. YYML68]|uniref:ABC transporter substrate-binding protein n=1 Tax=Paenibacillus sp. YYML68 TaxID=2909250 RepID=UPI002493B03A|nr:ABC transporter substrate binding protein [Paenibacillus sp. YYML68]